VRDLINLFDSRVGRQARACPEVDRLTRTKHDLYRLYGKTPVREWNAGHRQQLRYLNIRINQNRAACSDSFKPYRDFRYGYMQLRPETDYSPLQALP